MRHIIRVAPLHPSEAALMAEAEKNLGISRAVYEGRQKEYLAALEGLKKKYDPKFAENSKSQIHKYSAQVIDNCVVISLE